MRKFRILSFLFIASAFTFIISSCTKEGPEGPVGAQGAQGPAGSNGANGSTGAPGAPGAPGSANVIYSAWTLTGSGWITGDDDSFSDNVWGHFDKTAPGITQAVMDNGVVLCYGKGFIVGADTPLPGVVQLPYLENFNIQYYGFIIRSALIRFTYDPGQGPIRTDDQLQGISYRYVIIPGGVSGGRVMSGAAAGYTVDQLKKMPYEKMLALLKVPAQGTNIR